VPDSVYKVCTRVVSFIREQKLRDFLHCRSIWPSTNCHSCNDKFLIFSVSCWLPHLCQSLPHRNSPCIFSHHTLFSVVIPHDILITGALCNTHSMRLDDVICVQEMWQKMSNLPVHHRHCLSGPFRPAIAKVTDPCSPRSLRRLIKSPCKRSTQGKNMAETTGE